MIRLHRIHATDTTEYQFMEHLLTSAFPKEEYRDLDQLRLLTSSKQIFHNNLIYDDIPVGLVTYWELGRFCFMEHFATLPEMRNKGYGKKVLDHLQSHLHAPLVLEAEYPVEEIARRRIGFYERQNFVLWNHEYMQPPYRPEDNFLKMVLMVHGDLKEDRDFDFVRRTIYKEVYMREV